METKYFIIVNGQQAGPFPRFELRAYNLTPESFVWREGLQNWVKAGTLPELADLFVEESAFGTYAEMPQEPLNSTEYQGINPDSHPNANANPYGQSGPGSNANPYGQPGSSSYGQPGSNSYGQPGPNPYGQPGPNPYGQPGYGQPSNSYGQPGADPISHTNWLPWAIIGTILGCCTSCIGVILGVIGIVHANKANAFYQMGNSAEGDRANSTAKIMVILSLVLAGLSIVGSIALFSSGSLEHLRSILEYASVAV